MPKHWLIKSEPAVYSIDDLAREKRTHWEGVRNYQARNLMREMRCGDQLLFYHSTAEPAGVAGLARVCREAYPDFSSWDPHSRYYDAQSTRENPRWFMVDVEFVERFPELVSLDAIRSAPGLQGMVLLKRSRLSVQPLQPEEFQAIVEMGRARLGRG